MTLVLPAEGSMDWDAALASVFAAIDARVAALEVGNLGTRLGTLEAANLSSRIGAIETGASAVAFSVRSYGATGNGSSDDTAALHAARDAAGVNATVYVPAGTYLTTGLALNKSGQTWQLAPGAEIRLAASTNPTAVVHITAYGVTVRGGSVNGTRTAQASTGNNGDRNIGVRVYNTTDARVEDVTVFDCAGEGVVVESAQRVWVTRNRITNCGVAGNRKAVQVFTWYGSSSGVYITGNLVDSTASACGGIAVSNTAAQVSDVRITNNSIIFAGSSSADTLGVEIYTGNPALYVNSDVTVANNFIYCSSGTNRAFGVSLGGVIRGAATGNVVRGCQSWAIEAVGSYLTVAGNTCAGGSGITVNVGSYGAVGTHIAVTGNVVTGTTGLPLTLVGQTQGLSNVTVTGNTFSGPYVLCDGTLTDVLISDNNFVLTQGGLLFATGPTATNVTRATVRGNHIYAPNITTSDGVVFNCASATACVVSNNTITGFRYGVYGLTGGTKISVLGNRISACSNGGVWVENGHTAWTVMHNVIVDNPGRGINITSGDKMVVLFNVVRDNTSWGIVVQSCTNTAYGQNVAINNAAGNTSYSGTTSITLV